MSESKEFPKSLYRGEKDHAKAEHCVVHHKAHEEEARAEGFVSGHEFFGEAEPEAKKKGKKAKQSESDWQAE